MIDINTFVNAVERTILNNLESSSAIEDELFSKTLYKKATDAIDEIAMEIECCLENKQQKHNYRCNNCESEYIFYQELPEFECTVCKDMVRVNQQKEAE